MPPLTIGLEVSHLLAAFETEHSRHQYISQGHLLCGLTKIEDLLDPNELRQIGLTSQNFPEYLAESTQLLGLLVEAKLEPRKARHEMRELLGDGGYERPPDAPISRSPEARAAYERAERIAEEANASATGVQHLLAALLEGDDVCIRQLLDSFGVDRETLRTKASALPITAPSSRATSYLDQIGVDLVQQAREEKLAEVIGRRDEMLQVIRTLGRDTKNNPVLIGDAGVGKTAIVEGIAQRIASGNIDPDFQNKRIIQLDAADLVQGTRHRGDFEERMRQIIAEASNADDVILFIDEVHLLVGAGSSSGSMDAANILKPALARGDLRLIGATTDTEYRRTIARDSALERRFNPIRVMEPSPEATYLILKGLRDRLQQRNGVIIQPEAIDAAVRLSVRFLPDRRLPDKARDLLVDACSRVRYQNLSFHPALDESSDREAGVITEATIREVVAEQTGIPVAQLSADERERLLGMEQALRQRVIGQDRAIEAIAKAVRLRAANLLPSGRPVGVFLFAGPTGVGKTELAKATAEFLFGSDERMIRLDLSEYGERHNVARLIGAPPGYVGYEQGGSLTEALRKSPYAVVLFDEVDKAHPEVLDIFLQVFGEGRLTDGHGSTVDASNALFIMTSNLGQSAGIAKPGNGHPSPSAIRAMVEAAVRQHLRPELLNRIDEIVYFEPIGPQQMEELVQIQLKQFSQLLLREHGIHLSVTPEAVSWLAQRGYDPQLGARPLQRVIDQELSNQIGLLLLSGKLKSATMLEVTREGDGLQLACIGADTVL